MHEAFQFLGNFWWLIFVFGGTIGGALKGVAVANERRIERRQERFRLKQQTKVAIAQANAQHHADEETQRRELAKAIEQHDAVDVRWFAYELDPVTLLDTPMMTDMREPLTAEFHRAKYRADLLRPGNPETMIGNQQAQTEYREAVHAYAIAFEIAEAEAKRRRRSGFTLDEQERLVRAQRLLRLAMDEGATPQERQSAYRKAHKELDGLLVLPDRARAAIEHKIARAIGA
ncbi:MULTISPECIES: hypothetical protein [Rhodococcus]|jgi:hypothetical protein|uniref:hypothetical protein n=1 Tax=Rhodococcus TaxID=1827 RepID=UPI0013036D7C|nr:MULTISPECIES: hypothetical protein [unclassified Rhodococcus (in: high G+C Gram-positive bacteria)]MBW0285483.1 hypothetical protein [Rhodococcus sp. FH8]